MIVIVDADDDNHADNSEADKDQGEGAGGDTVNGLAVASNKAVLLIGGGRTCPPHERLFSSKFEVLVS